MTDFMVKYNWFVAESDDVEKYCELCGDPFTVDKRQGGHKTKCDPCQQEYQIQQAKTRYACKTKFFDPECDLVFAVIQQAQRDNDKEFLEDGAPLWFRALGLNLQPSMIEKLKGGEILSKKVLQ
jgi:hypothetical protein